MGNLVLSPALVCYDIIDIVDSEGVALLCIAGELDSALGRTSGGLRSAQPVHHVGAVDTAVRDEDASRGVGDSRIESNSASGRHLSGQSHVEVVPHSALVTVSTTFSILDRKDRVETPGHRRLAIHVRDMELHPGASIDHLADVEHVSDVVLGPVDAEGAGAVAGDTVESSVPLGQVRAVDILGTQGNDGQARCHSVRELARPGVTRSYRPSVLEDTTTSVALVPLGDDRDRVDLDDVTTLQPHCEGGGVRYAVVLVSSRDCLGVGKDLCDTLSENGAVSVLPHGDRHVVLTDFEVRVRSLDLEADMSCRWSNVLGGHVDDRYHGVVWVTLGDDESDDGVSNVDCRVHFSAKKKPEREGLPRFHADDRLLLRAVTDGSHWYPLTNL